MFTHNLANFFKITSKNSFFVKLKALPCKFAEKINSFRGTSLGKYRLKRFSWNCTSQQQHYNAGINLKQKQTFVNLTADLFDSTDLIWVIYK